MCIYRIDPKTIWLQNWLFQVEIHRNILDSFELNEKFSSPHLIEVRERIRINGELISKEKFIDYFWKCYNTINDAVRQSTEKVNQCKSSCNRSLQFALGSHTITFLFCLSNNNDVLHICS